MTDTERLQEIRARADAATSGPWKMRESAWEATWAVEGPRGFDQRRAPFHLLIDDPGDAAFIAHAREDIPRLLDALASLQRRNADREGENVAQRMALAALRNENALLRKATRDLAAVLKLCAYWRDLTEPTDVTAPMLGEKICEMLAAYAYATSQPQENTPE